MSSAFELQSGIPGVFRLDGGDRHALRDYLRGVGWLGATEEVAGTERAGAGNMNCTVRVRTPTRTFILKQALPWVAKYPQIPAPWDRAIVEGRFYSLAASVPALAQAMPQLLGLDEESRMLCLEDLGAAGDFTAMYASGGISRGDLEALVAFLAALHDAFRTFSDKAAFANREMRELNHQHMFAIPLAGGNGLHLDAITPGLEHAARRLRADPEYKRAAADLGLRYLSEGDCLLHGDYFPGSWLKTPAGVKVIDPEFCFFGAPEFDLGVLLAHLCLAGSDPREGARVFSLYGRAVDQGLAVRFAGIEIMRRLIGVAQLSLTLDLRAKTRLLEQSREMVLHAA